MKVRLKSLFEIGSRKSRNREVEGEILIDTNDIIYTGEVYNDGKVKSIDRCRITVRDVGDFIIHDNFDNINKLQLHKNVVGFYSSHEKDNNKSR